MESLVLGLVAGLVGTAFAVAGFNVLRGALPLGAWSERPALDWTLFGAAMIVAILASLAVAFLPAYSVWRSDLRTQLSGSRMGGRLQRRGGLQVLVVVGEVAAAVLLACGAGLLMRSVTNLYAIKPGLETRGIAVVDIATPANLRRAERRELMRNLVRELSALPGVKTAAVAQKLPLRGNGNSSGITVPGAPTGVPTTAFFRVGSADYFKTLGIPVLGGRTFDGSERTDSANAEMAVVINEALAKIYYPNINPVGQVMTGGFGVPERIVGVVGNVAEARLTDPPAPVRYYLTDQSPWVFDGQSLVIRTTRAEDAIPIIAVVRRTIAKVAPNVAVQEATTMQRVFDHAVGPARDVRTLLAILSALALLLGAIGIYGVIAQYVARREGDWSIRVALGLSPSRVVSLVVAHGTWMVVVGIIAGVGGSVVLGRFLSTLLYGVTAADPITIIGASIALLTIGVVAAFIPAVRASRADPALVLRKL
jgi:predicted permease